MIAAVLRRPRGLAVVPPGLLGPEIAFVALADGLFWGHAVGVSLPLFCGVAAIAAAGWRGGGTRRVPGLLLLAAALLPAVERPTALSVAFAVAATLAFPHVGAGPDDRPRRFRATLRDGAAGPRRIVLDLVRRRRVLARRRAARPGGRPAWVGWVAPLGLLVLFTALLACANPLIAGWIAALPLPSADDGPVILLRVLFWIAVLAKLWPLFRSRRPKLRPSPPRGPAPARDALGLDRLAAPLLSPAAVIRTLVLLDLLLALQIGLDGAYLWGGLALPDGLTYAAYAHRGAYPLIATASIAGCVALAIRRPGAPPPAGTAAALLLVFVGENILLVVSAMERVAVYVAAYALTEWRLAAFGWMGLVCFGLASIAVGGALRRDGRWLLRVNAAAALAVVYGWCLLGAPRLVADYDVAHCAELRGDGPPLDFGALIALGPDAIPALDRYRSAIDSDRWPRVDDARARLAGQVRAGTADWRGWSFAGWRLARYLDTSGVAEPATPPAGDDGS